MVPNEADAQWTAALVDLKWKDLHWCFQRTWLPTITTCSTCTVEGKMWYKMGSTLGPNSGPRAHPSEFLSFPFYIERSYTEEFIWVWAASQSGQSSKLTIYDQIIHPKIFFFRFYCRSKYFSVWENIVPYEKILFRMRKYLSAGDNSIRILCNFSSMENILSYPVKLYTKFILFGKYFSYMDKAEKCCIFNFSYWD
jgi:hypothetical protein